MIILNELFIFLLCPLAHQQELMGVKRHKHKKVEVVQIYYLFIYLFCLPQPMQLFQQVHFQHVFLIRWGSSVWHPPVFYMNGCVFLCYSGLWPQPKHHTCQFKREHCIIPRSKCVSLSMVDLTHDLYQACPASKWKKGKLFLEIKSQ